jgi:hypothetical protein
LTDVDVPVIVNASTVIDMARTQEVPMSTNPLTALADEHIRDLHATAARERLADLARCCRTALRQRLVARFRRTCPC